MKNKNLSVIIGVIVLIIILIVIVKAQKTQLAPQKVGSPIQDALMASEDLGKGSVNAPKDTTSGTAPVTLSYQNALAKYKDKRIQLNDQCQATPTNMTFKNKTDIMIDNRSGVGRTLKIGTTFTIKGYGFKIINVSSDKLPATLLVDCDKSQNVATILLQK